MTTEFFITDKILINQVIMPSEKYIGCKEFYNVEIEFEHDELEYMVLQLTMEDGFNKL